MPKHYEEDPKKIEDYLDKIDVSSKVLLNIINDILDMSSIENKKMKIAKEPFDLHEILMSVCTIYEPQCRQKGIAFEVQDEEVTPYTSDRGWTSCEPDFAESGFQCLQIHAVRWENHDQSEGTLCEGGESIL